MIEEHLSEEDKNKIELVLNAAKDFKTLFEDALDSLKDDLLHFYSLTRNKFSSALSEITSIANKTRE